MENKRNGEKKYELKQVAVRLKVQESDPILSREPVDCAVKAVRLLSDFMKNMDREYVYLLNCDTKMRPLSYSMIAIGGMNYAPIDPSVIFKTALLSNAANIMIMHLHPSGDRTPSEMDKIVTARLSKAGALMGIPVQDHLVVAAGTGDYYSMRLNMPELFTQSDAREMMAREDRALLVHEDATDIDPKVYNKVVHFLERQQELIQNAPEAWRIAKETAILKYSIEDQAIDTHNYATQKYIVETAEMIRSNDTGELMGYLADLGEKATDMDQARTAFGLIVSISSYGEWEDASREAIEVFEKGEERAEEVKQISEKAGTMSFSEKLEQKSREADAINEARASSRQLLDRPQGEREAI